MSTIAPPNSRNSADYSFELPDIPKSDLPNPLRELDPETLEFMMDQALEIAEKFKLAMKEIERTNQLTYEPDYIKSKL